MPRARNIKPDFFIDDQLADCSIHARYLCPALWCIADREGRLVDAPRKIGAFAFPYEHHKLDIHELLEELVRSGHIIRYESANMKLIQIVNFKKHQSPHRNEAESLLQAPEHSGNGQKGSETNPPDCGLMIDDSNTLSSCNSDRSHTEVAKDLLQFLNDKAGRRFQPVKANLSLIVARLKDGATEQQIRQVIARKCQQWRGDPTMAQYMRPATLFNATKFAQYVGELGSPLKVVQQ